MTVSDKIRILCIRRGITMRELALRMGMSPQNFSGKLKRESFSYQELEAMAKAADCQFRLEFVLPDGDVI